ncbi:MAG: hypothetical protein ACJARP_000002 [Vicingaceae bacterium]|jgi:hypothetical protein
MNIHEHTFHKEHPLSSLLSEAELLNVFDENNVQESNVLFIIKCTTTAEVFYFYLFKLQPDKNLHLELEYLNYYYEMVYHQRIEDYVFMKMIQDSINFSPKLNLIISYIEDVERHISNTYDVIAESAVSDLLPKMKMLNTSVQRLLMNLKRYNREEYNLYLEKLEKQGDDIGIINLSGNIKDNRFKVQKNNAEIAYAIKFVFGTHINSFNKEDKKVLLQEITGRSGSDLYNNWDGRKNLTDLQRIEIEKTLTKYKLK